MNDPTAEEQHAANVAAVREATAPAARDIDWATVNNPTLGEFLTARLDEDEATAQAMRHDEVVGDPFYSCPATRAEGDWGDLPWGPDACDCGLGRRQARVLRDLESKRAIVELIPYLAEPGRRGDLLRLLAAVYSDHSDYDEAWRP